MEREAFRQRMQQYKQARESNPQLKYWDWKKYADGGTVEEDPPTTSERPIINFNPKGNPYEAKYGYNPGDYNIDTGLIRHEIGHKVDIDATRGAVNTNPFMQDLAKDILPYDQARYMLHGIENPVESYKYLTTPTEIKSHMNQFRQYLIDNKIMKPGDKVDDVPNFFMHLQAAPDEYKGIKLLQNLFKNDRAFKKRFDQIPLTNINDNRVIA